MQRAVQIRRARPSLSWTKPLPDFYLEADTGWLSPGGLLYACNVCEHESLADALGIPMAPFGGAAGWLHLEDGFWKAPEFEVSQKQIDSVFVWCARRNATLPVWFSRGRS